MLYSLAPVMILTLPSTRETEANHLSLKIASKLKINKKRENSQQLLPELHYKYKRLTFCHGEQI